MPEPDWDQCCGGTVTPILGTATASIGTVRGNIPSAVPRVFIERIFPACWNAALEHRINPVVQVAQSALETGWGRFGGVLDATYHNTCGLKNRGGGGDYEPAAHARFPDWATGARAHAQHLLRYTGATAVPGGKIVDPRWSLVGPPYISTVEGLEGRWATSAGYAADLLGIIGRLEN